MVRTPRLAALMLLLVMGSSRIVAIGCGISCLPDPASPAAGGHCREAASPSADAAALVGVQPQGGCDHQQSDAEMTLTSRAQVQSTIHQDALDAHSTLHSAAATRAARARWAHSPPGITPPPIAPLRI